MTTTMISTTTAAVAATLPVINTINIDDDSNIFWKESDLDYVNFESTTRKIPVANTLSHFFTPFREIANIPYGFPSIPLPPIEHFDFIKEIPVSSTIVGGLAVAQQDFQLNWWDLQDASFPPMFETSKIHLTTTVTTTTVTLILTTDLKSYEQEEDEWSIFDTSSKTSITESDYPNSELDFDMNDYFVFPTLSTTLTTDMINYNTQPFVPYYFTDYKTKEQLLDLMKPIPTLVPPPFSWMLHMAYQNKTKSKGRQNLNDQVSAMTLSPVTSKKKNKKNREPLKITINNNYDYFFEYCNKKQCQNGGRLNSYCLCICLPAFSGDNCEKSKYDSSLELLICIFLF